MDTTGNDGLSKTQAVLFFLLLAVLAVLVLAAEHILPLRLVKLGVAGVVAAVAALLVFAYPKHGLYFAIFYIYAGLAFYLPFPASYPIVALITAAVLFSLMRGEHIRLREPLFTWSTAVFTIIAIQSMLFSWDTFSSVGGLGFYAKSIVMVYLVAQLLRTPRDVENYAFVLFAASFAVVFFGVINMHFGLVKDQVQLVGTLGEGLRFGGTHVNPNNAAIYMLSGLPLGIYAVKRTRWALLRILLVLAVISIVIGTVMTFSRQTIFSLGIVFLAILFKEAKSKWVYLVVVLVLLVGVLLTPRFYWQRILSIGEVFSQATHDWSLMLRLLAIKTAWHLFLQHPLTGVGINNFWVRSASELPARIVVHNAYLEILVGVGIVGFAAFWAIVVSGLRGFWRALRTRWECECRWMNDLSFYFLLSFVCTLIGALFEAIQWKYELWLPIALGVTIGRLSGESHQKRKMSETR